MPFSDFRFIYVALALTVILLRFLPKGLKNPFLMLSGVILSCMSVGFAFPDWLFLPGAIVLTWLCSSLMSSLPRKKGPIAALFLVLLSGGMWYFKYYLCRIPLGGGLVYLACAGFIIDMSRRKKTDHSLINIGAYLSFYPKLYAGPLIKWSDFRPQIDGRNARLQDIAEGVRMFITGLALKTLIADRLAAIWDGVSAVGAANVSTALVWFAAITFGMRLYFELYGFSLMAIGLGKSLGVTLPSSFDYPLTAHTVTGFWRRWNMTVVGWFKEYIFLPLSRGREKKKNFFVFNAFITCTLFALWHGCRSSFVLCAMLQLILLSVERLGVGRFLDKHRGIAFFYMLFFLPISAAIFATDNVYASIYVIVNMFRFRAGGDIFYVASEFILPVAAGLMLITPIPARIFEKFRRTLVGSIVYALMFGGSLYALSMRGGSSSLFFNF